MQWYSVSTFSEVSRSTATGSDSNDQSIVRRSLFLENHVVNSVSKGGEPSRCDEEVNESVGVIAAKGRTVTRGCLDRGEGLILVEVLRDVGAILEMDCGS